MIQFPVGTVQTVTVVRITDEHYTVRRESKEIALHHDDQLAVGEIIEVFIYNDRNGNVVATTTIPSIQKGTYGWAKVIEVIPRLGVFVDIGIDKDILVSVDDLPIYETVWPKVDDQLYVTLGEDQEGRLLAIPASEQIFTNIRELAHDDLFHTEAIGHVYYTSREGAAIFTKEGYRGFIHHTERKKEPRLGELIKGRIIEVKEDGTINVSLLPLKQDRISNDTEAIMSAIEEHGGEIPLDDYSDPADIREMFGFSKSAFKRAIGRLMREGKVEQQDGKTIVKQ